MLTNRYASTVDYKKIKMIKNLPFPILLGRSPANTISINQSLFRRLWVSFETET